MAKYSPDEIFSLDETGYIIQQVENNDMARTEEKQKQGFCFHERFLFMEINLKVLSDVSNRVCGDTAEISLKMSYEYPEDLYALAYESFETDRCFHFEQQFDQSRANVVKEAYINRCKAGEMIVFSARKADVLLGYIIADTHSGKGTGCF